MQVYQGRETRRTGEKKAGVASLCVKNSLGRSVLPRACQVPQRQLRARCGRRESLHFACLDSGTENICLHPRTKICGAQLSRQEFRKVYEVLVLHFHLKLRLLLMALYFMFFVEAHVATDSSLMLSGPKKSEHTIASIMTSTELSAGLGLYVAARQWRELWPYCAEADVAKAQQHALRDDIVHQYLKGAKAAGLPEHRYLRKDLFRCCLRWHCPQLREIDESMLTQAFQRLVKIKYGRTLADEEPVKIIARNLSWKNRQWLRHRNFFQI